MNRIYSIILLALTCGALAAPALRAGPEPGATPDGAADRVADQGTFLQGKVERGTWEQLNVGVNGFDFEFRIWTDGVTFVQPVKMETVNGKTVLVLKWLKQSVDAADPYDTSLWHKQLGGTMVLDPDTLEGSYDVEDYYQNDRVVQHNDDASFRPCKFGK